MEENHDSSAPNSPELTRLSGEQSEERTAREGRIWREAFQSALAFASPSPRYGVHRRGDRIFSRMMDLESEANQQCDRELAKRHEAGDSPTKPQACASCSRLASRVEELEKLLRRYEPDPDFSQKELVQWHHTRMHEVVNRAYRVYCDTKTVFPKGLARWMGVNTEDDFSKVISEREMRKKLEEQNAYLSGELSKRDKGLETLRERIRELEVRP